MKMCSDCREMLPLTSFYKQGGSPDGMGYRCKPCKKAHQVRQYKPPQQTGQKTCRTCGVAKEVDAFHVAPTYPDGRKPDCRPCHAAADRTVRENRPADLLLRNAQSRAKAKNIPFNITIHDICVPSVCPVLGIPLHTGRGAVRDNSPSLDRMHPERGYVRGNVRVISWRANRLKTDATVAEMRAVLRYMES